MYPLLGIAAFNMSPETFINFEDRHPEIQALDKIFGTQNEEVLLALTTAEWAIIKTTLKKHNVCISIGGAVFDKSYRGTIAQLVTDIYGSRKIAKKEMFNFEQEAIDIKAELKKRGINV